MCVCGICVVYVFEVCLWCVCVCLRGIHMVLWIQGKISLVKLFADHLCVGMSTQSLNIPHLECLL